MASIGLGLLIEFVCKTQARKIQFFAMGTEHSLESHSANSCSEVSGDSKIVKLDEMSMWPSSNKDEAIPNDASKTMIFQPGDEVEVAETFVSESQTLKKGCCGIIGDIDENGYADIDFFFEGQSGKQFAEWVRKDNMCKLRSVALDSRGASATIASSSEAEGKLVGHSIASDSDTESDVDVNDADEDMLSSPRPKQEPESPAARRRRGLAALHEAKVLYKEMSYDDLEDSDKSGAEEPDEGAFQNCHQVVQRGVIIRLRGLGSQSHLNGQLGLVLYPGKDDRWAVHLDCEEPGCFRNVREQNLEFMCFGGAVQPRALQQEVSATKNSTAAGVSQDNPFAVEGQAAERSPTTAGKRKHNYQDEDMPSEMSLAEQFAALEREQFAYLENSPCKRRALSKDSNEAPIKHGVDGLVEDILEAPQAQLFRRLLAASTDDLAKVVSPEATAYVVLARSFRTRSSGA